MDLGRMDLSRGGTQVLTRGILGRVGLPRWVGAIAFLGGVGRIIVATMLAVSAPVLAGAEPVLVLPAPPANLPFVSSLSGDWTLMLGANGYLQPDFEGAKRYTFSPTPIISVERAGSVARFRDPRDGPSIALFDLGGFRAGPSGKLVSTRKASSYTELNGLGDVKTAIEIGAFAEYFPVDWLRGRAELYYGFLGFDGIVANFSADLIVPVLDRFTLSAGPRLTVENTGATAPYFSITPTQSLASGLPTYDAKGGIHSVGAGGQLRYQMSPQWEVHGLWEYARLVDGAAASPLVTLRGSPNQTSAGIGASYSFDVRVR
jgi:outer membrane protein